MGHFLNSKSEKGSVRSLLRSHRSSASGNSSRYSQPQNLTAEAVAALPPPGLSGPSSPVFSPPQCINTAASSSNSGKYLAFLSSSMQVASNSRRYPRHATQNGSITATSTTTTTTTGERQLCVLDLEKLSPQSDIACSMFPLLRLPQSGTMYSKRKTEKDTVSLEERLRRERQRLHSSGGATQFTWCRNLSNNQLRVMVPLRGNIYIQDGVKDDCNESPLRLVYDRQVLQETLFGKTAVKMTGPIVGRDAGAIDPQLSSDGSMVAFVVAGDIYVLGLNNEDSTPVRLTFRDSEEDCITHGLADFVAQEEMDRYRGYWWDPSSTGILLTRVDETNVPPYRITHQGRDGSVDEAPYEDHRYPFAGRDNPKVQLGYVAIDRNTVLNISTEEETKSVSNIDMVDDDSRSQDNMSASDDSAEDVAQQNWARTMWLDPPREAHEYLARVLWLPDGSACAQWQNRAQSTLVLVRIDLQTGKTRTLLTERSDVWINLNHMMQALPRAVHPDECVPVVEKHRFPTPLPPGSFSFFFASERSGYTHLYLYTYAPGCNGERAALVRTISGGDWIVESIVGVDMENDAVYVTGTYGSPLERHLLALPITNRERPEVTAATEDYLHNAEVPFDGKNHDASGGVRRGLKHVMSALSGKPSSYRKSSGSLSSMESASYHTDGTTRIPDPIRLTAEPGMHNVVMDDECKTFVDTCSDLNRPTTVKVYTIPDTGPFVSFPTNGSSSSKSKKSSRKQVDANESRNGYCSISRLLCVLYDAAQDDKAMPLLSSIAPDTTGTEWLANLPPPELLSFPTSDGTETLHAALYKPDAAIHGSGPYPLICAVYGGPHVQRVNRSWSQSADMRAQLLRSLGFAVVKCDNRGSSRRGLAFECAIRRRLGRLEVLDQVTTVRQLAMRGIADPNRVGIYGWSYGGYLAAMCLCRAPDVFHVAVAGAPVTSWDGYDTHYTERYMGLPSENPGGYREAAIFDHVPNMEGKLMIVHGLIDENVHFRHTARLINRLIAAGKDYDLLIFPDERHSPRRLRDRIYMEQRISDYFLRNLMDGGNEGNSSSRSGSSNAMRTMPGHL